jgi:ADP-heptose:LPS heptosyltransferase
MQYKFFNFKKLNFILLTTLYNHLISPKNIFRIFSFFTKKINIVNNNYKSILIVKLDAIGDFVLLTPFLRELKSNYPNSYVTLIVSPASFSLAEVCPYIDQVLVFNSQTNRVFAKLIILLRSIKFAFLNFKDKDFDLAISPRWDIDLYFASYLIFFSRAKMRIAYSEKVNILKSRLNKNYDLFYTDLIYSQKNAHEVELNLDILNKLGCSIKSKKLELWTTQNDDKFSNIINKTNNNFFIAIIPGANDKNRQWPISYLVSLIEQLINIYNINIVLLGGINDTLLADEIIKKVDYEFINLIGKTTLREATSILNKCDLYIGNDTGLKHIAAAVDVKVIEISRFHINGHEMHHQSPCRFHAWGVDNFVLQPKFPIDDCDDDCKYNFSHCIKGVYVNDVLSIIRNNNLISNKFNKF